MLSCQTVKDDPEGVPSLKKRINLLLKLSMSSQICVHSASEKNWKPGKGEDVKYVE